MPKNCKRHHYKRKVTVKNPSDCGIYVQQGNLTIKGGTVSVTEAYEDAIYLYGNDYRGKRYGGKVKVTGGKLTATVRKPKSYSAIRADSMSNKPSCLKKIVGRLPKGALFKSGGNTYQASDYGYVNLYRYGSKKTTAKFNKVKYGKHTYCIGGVASKAFNTQQGAKLTSITFVNGLRTIGSKAFYGTKSLRSLTLKQGFSNVYMSYNGRQRKLYVNKESFKCAKNAFSGMGANGGNGLTFSIRGNTEDVPYYRNWLLKKGLPKGTRVACAYYY